VLQKCYATLQCYASAKLENGSHIAADPLFSAQLGGRRQQRRRVAIVAGGNH